MCTMREYFYLLKEVIEKNQFNASLWGFLISTNTILRITPFSEYQQTFHENQNYICFRPFDNGIFRICTNERTGCHQQHGRHL